MAMSTNKKTALSAAVIALVVAGAGSDKILDKFLQEKEGFSLESYRDGAKVWTDCNGRTEGVKTGSVATVAECKEWLKQEIGRRFIHVDRTIKVQLSPAARAGVTSFCFNVGNSSCENSSAIRLINQGNRAGGCDAMLRFKYITRGSRKIDCSAVQPYCSGLWERRLAERELCML
jgi:lysozyme